METKRIKCPSCGVVLDVRNSQNETEKLIVCPQCRVRLKVLFSPSQAISQTARETQYISNDGAGIQYSNNDNGETQYVGVSSAKFKEKASNGDVQPGYLSCKGKKYPLSLGSNIIGRMAASSQATVQIATDDKYMSRQHLTIQIIKLSPEKVKVIVSNKLNKNASYVNGELLNDDDQLVLTDGSCIKMGNTIVTYHQK